MHILDHKQQVRSEKHKGYLGNLKIKMKNKCIILFRLFPLAGYFILFAFYRAWLKYIERSDKTNSVTYKSVLVKENFIQGDLDVDST